MTTTARLRSTPPSAPHPSAGLVAATALADAVAVAAFTAIGRSSHAEAGSLVGLASTTWPFLVGAGAGWLAGRVWRAPLGVRRASAVWGGAVAVGMVLRVAAGQGTALSFTVVTAVVLGAFLLGWRAVVAAVRRRRG